VRPRPVEADRGGRFRGVSAGVACHDTAVRRLAWAGAFVVSLDSMVNVAFPAMAASFGLAPEQVRWVIVCYVLTYAITAFTGGAAADRLGHVGVFTAGLAFSAMGFLVAGAAPTYAALLAGRVVQGVGGGLVYGTVPGLVTLSVDPPDRARALGALNAAIGLGLAVGPVASGLLLDAAGWPAIFYARAPLAAVLLVWAWRSRPAMRGGAPRLVAARDVLRRRVLHAGALAFLANAGIFAIWLLAPFYLVGTRGLSALAAGVLFMLTPLGTAVASSLSGRAVGRLGTPAALVAGLVVEAVGLVLLSRADAATPVAAIAAALFAAGFGIGFFQVPNMTSLMAAFSAGQQGAAGGFAFLSRTLGVVAGVLVLAQVFAVRRTAIGPEAAFGEAFLVAAAVVAAAAALSSLSSRAG
jgi:DHA2 family methylenomycin A resistance protein-like MFS transporter